MRRARKPTLARDGYTVCDRIHMPERISLALRQLSLRRPSSTGLPYNSGRRGLVFDPKLINAQEWACLFPPEYIRTLENYLGENIEVLRTEVISVPALSDTQYTHRDHALGARVSVCVVISADHINVGTLIIPGSHAHGDLLPLGDLVASATTYLMYDTHTFHAGCGNPKTTPTNNRLFVTFRSSSLTRKQKGALSRDTGKPTHNPRTLRSLLSPSPPITHTPLQRKRPRR